MVRRGGGQTFLWPSGSYRCWGLLRVTQIPQSYSISSKLPKLLRFPYSEFPKFSCFSRKVSPSRLVLWELMQMLTLSLAGAKLELSELVLTQCESMKVWISKISMKNGIFQCRLCSCHHAEPIQPWLFYSWISDRHRIQEFSTQNNVTTVKSSLLCL